MLGVIKEHDPGNDVGENTRSRSGTTKAARQIMTNDLVHGLLEGWR
jgi:hypothetical protein